MLIPVILCGGSGSRLWPLSRETHPKQFIKLSDGETLLQKTFLRASTLTEVSDVIFVTNQQLAYNTEQQLALYAKANQKLHFLLEPIARNTAAAVALAILYAKEHIHPSAQLLILPADHLINDARAFHSAVKQARILATETDIVTFGIKPSRVECGYGYIEKGQRVSNTTDSNEAFKVQRFVEKPNLEKAKQYTESGHFVWNSGMYCLSIATASRAYTEYAAEIMTMVKAAYATSKLQVRENNYYLEIPKNSFDHIANISFDYTIMEHYPATLVIESNLDWNDVGAWNSMAQTRDADENGNQICGDVFLQETKDCYIHSENRFIGVLGAERLIVVDTPDALLISHVDKVQSVRDIVEHLKKNNQSISKEHKTVSRPWGSYTILEETAAFKIKQIRVNPCEALSLQMHAHRSEHWVIVQGTARVTNGEEVSVLHPNQSTYISQGNKHRLENIGNQILIVIEVQTGSYLGEDDIVRFDDIYQRTVTMID
jgi:mannose-1-phosphate guanylyltransferase/mannose-6-phosphate isomerase